jgi:hypothetical protein
VDEEPDISSLLLEINDEVPGLLSDAMKERASAPVVRA